MITKQFLQEHFRYNHKTGQVFSRLKSGKYRLLSGIRKDGYMQTSKGGIKLYLHRIAYLMHSDLEDDSKMLVIDHIDHNRSNNKIDNLRSVSFAENGKNLSLSPRSKTGICGVYLRKSGKYRAMIMINGKNKCIGTFSTKEKAAQARKKANIKYNFHHNHGDNHDNSR